MRRSAVPLSITNQIVKSTKNKAVFSAFRTGRRSCFLFLVMLKSIRMKYIFGGLSMKKWRVGIIGVGGIFNGAHREHYLKDDRLEVVALCDIIEERAAICRDKFFPDAKVYTDFNELLKDETIDSVDICTPNYLHSIIAVAAFKAGKYVVVQTAPAVSTVEHTMHTPRNRETFTPRLCASCSPSDRMLIHQAIARIIAAAAALRGRMLNTVPLSTYAKLPSCQ